MGTGRWAFFSGLVGPEGTGVEYGLIVSFALLIGFCLGVLVMTLLDASEAKERSGRAAVRVHEASPSRR